jgi:hypothetical membrane protein
VEDEPLSAPRTAGRPDDPPDDPLDKLSRGSRWMAAGGIVGPVAFVAAWALCGRAAPGYAPTRDAISELGAIGASTRTAMTAGFVVFGVGITVYAQALRRWIEGPAWITATGCGLATLGVAAVPLGSISDGLHGTFAVVGYVMLAATPSVASRPLGRAGCSRAGRASVVAGLVSGACLAASLVGPHHGTFQRLGLTIGDAWLVASAVAMLARPRYLTTGPRHRTGPTRSRAGNPPDAADGHDRTMDLQGECLQASERIVVTPAAGVFVPADPLPRHVEVGSTLGFIHGQASVTPVRSSFRGTLVALVAATGERLVEHQRVAWLRA